uniref:D-aminoacyl-tRNA deacylase n=1 Tax=Tanacetum cinerariifolium TaxID=118510 RepID=A0A6L2NSR0_TANCI|nr:D-aminoacyl-tRNA deacylase [Tanacetum cinerariifolium]
MVTLVVSTTTDPASFGPASALTSLGNWTPGISFQGVRSKVYGEVRLLEHDTGIVEEDHLDKRWEDVSGEVVDEIVFLSKHTAVTNRPALTIHPIEVKGSILTPYKAGGPFLPLVGPEATLAGGPFLPLVGPEATLPLVWVWLSTSQPLPHTVENGVPHLKEGDVPSQGGKPGWAAVPSPRMTSWLILLKKIAQSHNLVPEFEITLEATHHGPVTNKPTMFVEIGSTIDCWKRQDAAQVIAQLVWEGLGIGGGEAVGNWNSMASNKKVLLGVGGGHYVPRHMDIIMKGGVWVCHLLSGYSLPMEDPAESKGEKDSNNVGGTWKHAIKTAYDATVEGFPGGEVIAHLDHKSFKGWQKKAIIEYLSEQNIKIGKPNDFY